MSSSPPLRRPRRPRRRAAAVAIATVLGSVAVGVPAEARPSSATALAGRSCAYPPVGSSLNAPYVAFVYAKILDRCPEPGGWGYWTGLLDGGLSRAAFTEGVDVSEENIALNNVDEAYDRFVDRAPTAAERAGAIENVRASHADAALVSVLVASDDYYLAKADEEDDVDGLWLEHVYDDILDRAPDVGGAAYYRATFGTDGSDFTERFKVAWEMEHSTENAIGWTTGVYFAALGRPPSPAELQAGVDWLQGPGMWQTFRLWTRTLSSDEAYGIATGADQ